MLVTAFTALGKQLVVITGLISASAFLVWAWSGRDAAYALIGTAVAGMKAPWVWTFGFGLASFVATAGRQLPLAVDGILAPSQTTLRAIARIANSTHHRNALNYTAPITALGVILTLAYGIPNTGLAGVLIFVAVCSIYYIAGFLLFHFVEVIQGFHELFEKMDDVEFRSVYNPFHIENLTTYLSLSTAIGLIAIYAGFRGTLTAGFRFDQEVWRTFLSTPLVLFLPGTLLYNFYPRYVLRKILQYKVCRTMERLGGCDEQSARSLLLDLRENAAMSSHILPFLDYKSLPSYVIAVFFALSLAYHNDPAVKAFISYLTRPR